MKTHAQSLADALRKALVLCQPDYLKHPDQHATLLREIHAEAWTALNAFEKAEPATKPTPSSDPSEESLKDEDAFNDWNRHIDDYAPSLFEAYSYGLTCARSENAKVRTQAAMAGELAEEAGKYLLRSEEHAVATTTWINVQINNPEESERFKREQQKYDDACDDFESCKLVLTALLARFEATKSTKEATP